MPFLLGCLSDLELRLGRWQAAYANGRESVRVAEETGQRNVLSFGLVTLARVEAVLSYEADCRLHATLTDGPRSGSIGRYKPTSIHSRNGRWRYRACGPGS